MNQIDSALVFPYYTKVIKCAGCNHTFYIMWYGDRLDNLIAGLNELTDMERHVKNCHGNKHADY